MAYYWVNLGVSYKEVRDHNFLWAPSHTYTEKGEKTVKPGWKHVPHVKRGDVVICHENKRVIYIAQATKNAYPAPRPESRTFDEWKKDGYKIEVDLTILDTPVPNELFKHRIIERLNSKCDPLLFNVEANATQNYMVAIPDEVAAIVLSSLDKSQLIEFKVPPIKRNSSKGKARKMRKATKGGVRKAKVNARVGQGAFRDEVLEMWNYTCPVTKVNIPSLLIASHIVPWIMSEDDEKIDGYNGLPLAPNVDKLFDKGLISFTDDGVLLRSKSLPVVTLNSMGIKENTKVSGLTKEHAFYLGKHRELYGF
ncbi:HNH endonuclease [Vibrio coralliilyticus]|uniref:HNH endonuclease n=1 Tax=Vibrio coralliilyticus TaxID=190893 RepID=UPI00068ED24A|nr:HNH endonuclease signature motif containing protein [Vibrio coralliilyticus]NOH40128.1 HNH endonuclease [Vibrio coralliilyticus]